MKYGLRGFLALCGCALAFGSCELAQDAGYRKTGSYASSEARALAAVGGDVYVAGRIQVFDHYEPVDDDSNSGYDEGIYHPGYWKNGSWVDLPLPDPRFIPHITSLLVYGSDVYVGGYCEYLLADATAAGRRRFGGYWKNGAWTGLSADNELDTVVAALALSGDDLIAAGACTSGVTRASSACCWTDGSWSLLTKPGQYASSEARALAIAGESIYIGGICCEVEGSVVTSYPGYWKDGAWQEFAPASSGSVGAMAIDGDATYVAGSRGSACGYWKNGEWTPLVGDFAGYQVKAIAVLGEVIYALSAHTSNSYGGASGYWKNGTWSEPQFPEDYRSAAPTSLHVEALTAQGEELLIGGYFQRDEGGAHPYIALRTAGYWRDGAWTALPLPDFCAGLQTQF